MSFIELGYFKFFQPSFSSSYCGNMYLDKKEYWIAVKCGLFQWDFKFLSFGPAIYFFSCFLGKGFVFVGLSSFLIGVG